MSSLRVLMAGGGTAGHLFPCVAVAEELADLEPGCSIRYVGARGRIDEQILRERDLPHDLISARPLPYRLSAEAVTGLVALARAVRRTRAILRAFRPHIVFSTGGYVGASVGIAARLARIPLLVHVADTQPDRGNRLLARWACAITTISPEAARALGRSATVTGNPIRRELAQATREQGTRELGLDPDAATIVVTGGSQGARRLNTAVVSALPVLLDELGAQIVHLSGALDFETLRAEVARRFGSPPRYHLIAHLPNPGLALAAADLALTRAGAGSLAEVCLHGVPMIVVPYPFAGGHQRLNAAPLADAGAAVIVDDAQFTGERLVALVRDLLGDAARLAAMAAAARAAARPDAARQVAQVLIAAARGACGGGREAVQ